MKNMNSTKPEKKGIAKKFQKSDKNEIFVDIFEKLSVSISLSLSYLTNYLFVYRSFSTKMALSLTVRLMVLFK